MADLQGRLGPHVLQGKIFFLNWLRLDHFIFCFVLVFFRGGGLCWCFLALIKQLGSFQPK